MSQTLIKISAHCEKQEGGDLHKSIIFSEIRHLRKADREWIAKAPNVRCYFANKAFDLPHLEGAAEEEQRKEESAENEKGHGAVHPLLQAPHERAQIAIPSSTSVWFSY